MADLAATDVTLAFVAPKDLTRRRRMNMLDISFGDAAKTYPTNGVPLPAVARFGMFKQVDMMLLEPPPGNGYVYKYDRTNHTVRIYQSASHTHNLKVIGGITADEDVGVLASGPTLGKLAATDRTIAGADSATKGGVVALAAAALVELGAVAVAATAIRAVVFGK